MSTTIPRAEIDAVMECYGDCWVGPETVDDVRRVASVNRWYADNPTRGAFSQPEERRAEADDLDALADRYEQEAAQ